MKKMGEIRAKVLLQNEGDLYLREHGKGKSTKVRKVEMEAVVDTGAVLMLLPQELVEALGLPTVDHAVVALANDQKIEMDLAGPVKVTIAGRRMTTDVLVGPPNCEPLIGQVILERLDLIVDPLKRTLTVRPESPYLPTLKLKWAFGQTTRQSPRGTFEGIGPRAGP